MTLSPKQKSTPPEEKKLPRALDNRNAMKSQCTPTDLLKDHQADPAEAARSALVLIERKPIQHSAPGCRRTSERSVCCTGPALMVMH